MGQRVNTMEQDIKITAVVVTFNRKDMVLKCIQGVLNQTRKVDRILIIDNNSTDGTINVLQEAFNDNNTVTIVHLEENTGCTGGFYEGVRRAYEDGTEWIWLLDDDISPITTCLETMLKYEHISKCIHPNKVYSDGKEFLWESVFDPATGAATFMNNISFKNGKDFTFVNIGCFEGMLIHRDIVENIGYPDKRFFIVSDDTTYGFLASLFTNVTFIKDAYIQKLVPLNEKLSSTFIYYAIRNQFLVKEYLKKYNLYNKKLFNVYLVSFFFNVCTKQVWRNKNMAMIRYAIKGLRDGAQGKFYKINS